MKNIILLPLDERPCNFDFPSKIFNGEKYTIIRPEHLGQKKTPASYEFIREDVYKRQELTCKFA